MLNQPVVIASKEIVDGIRDVRSVISSLMYAAMGPVVVGLVSLAIPVDHGKAAALVLAGMMSVFTLVAAFAGGMNVAMDTVAGERERQSLVALLLNPVRTADLVTGKWLSVSFFAAAGLVINLLGFAIVFRHGTLAAIGAWPQTLLALMLGLLPLPFLAAALQLLISTVCRSVKEAQTYLSLLVFAPMGLGMFLVFVPPAAHGWCRFLPLAGQHLQLEALMSGGVLSLSQPAALGCFTAAISLAVLKLAANQLERDEIVYGN